MDKPKRFAETYLYSSVGIAGMAVLLIAINVISSAIHGRLDFTEEKLHTLSDGTKAILKAMDTEVVIRFYYSKDAQQMPMYLKNYARRADDLLKEYAQIAGGNITIVRKNPTPDSDEEDSANMDGVFGQQIGMTGDRIYLGLAVSCLDETVSIPFLSPDREDLLEYDVSRAVYRVLHPDKPVLGIMSSLPVFGQPPNPMMMRQMPQQNQRPWLFINELKRDFDVREVQTSAEEIDSDVNLLILIHPKELSDKTLFAIDQFVLGGGRVLAFMDASSTQDQQRQPMGGMQMPMPGGPSDLGVLMETWGIEFVGDKVLGDLTYKTTIRRQDGQPQDLPTVLSLNQDALDGDDPSTSQLNNLIFPFPGVFKGSPAEGLTKTDLIWSSEECQLVDRFMAQFPGDSFTKKFKAEDVKQILALRLSGKFKTAFPDGRPDDSGDDEDKDKEDEKADADFLREGEDGIVVLVADSDLLYDDFCVQHRQSLFGRVAVPISDNLSLVQNLAEQLSGDSNLVGIRCRGTIKRPFLVVNSIQAKAQQEYQDKIVKLEDDLSEIESKLRDLQSQKKQDQQTFMSPEVQEAIRKAQEKKAKTRKDLKETRKQLRRDIDALENGLKWINILLMPAIVSLGGIAFSIARRRRMQSR